MAILYGTTADGDSLPVEVNEFGQLIAQGLQGQEGPPGPPGIGQLPPDPFEGAILGWKDNTLSWLGGSVPLPAGTYGPITAYQDGVLTLQSPVDLPYLAAFYLSDALGDPVIWTPSTSLISNVNGNSLSLVDDTNLANFRVGDVVQSSGLWNQSQEWSATGTITGTPYDANQVWANAFNGVVAGAAAGNAAFAANLANYTYSFRAPIPFTSASLIGLASGGICTVNFGESDAKTVSLPENAISEVPFSLESGVLKNINVYTESVTGPYVYGINIDGRLLVDASVADPSNVAVTSISISPPRIDTDGGSWQGSDGSGDPQGERNVVGPATTGQGTVQAVAGNNIILRQDNGGWKIGGYITTPDQELAARLLYADDLLRSLSKQQ